MVSSHQSLTEGTIFHVEDSFYRKINARFGGTGRGRGGAMVRIPSPERPDRHAATGVTTMDGSVAEVASPIGQRGLEADSARSRWIDPRLEPHVHPRDRRPSPYHRARTAFAPGRARRAEAPAGESMPMGCHDRRETSIDHFGDGSDRCDRA